MQSQSVSFSCDQESEYLSFFHENGYVVIKDVLSQQEVADSVTEIWQNLEKLSPNLDRTNTNSWETSWPMPGGGQSKGFLDTLSPHEDVQAWLNRQNPKLVRVFQTILGKEQVWVVLDRFGVMRPTKGIALPDGTVVDKPDWKTMSSWLHWDQNPWREPDFVRIQGLIMLTDHTQTSGGFCTIPKFPWRFKKWAETNPIESVPRASFAHELIQIPQNDPMQQEKVAILGSAGSLVVWDSRMPHQNYPNDDNTFRIVQYVTFHPVPDSKEEILQKKKSLEEMIKLGLIHSEDTLNALMNAKGFKSRLKKEALNSSDDDDGDKVEPEQEPVKPVSILPRFFPQFLTSLGRKITGLQQWDEKDQEQIPTESLPDISQEQLEGLLCLAWARESECNGNPKVAVDWYQKSFKFYPALKQGIGWI